MSGGFERSLAYASHLEATATTAMQTGTLWPGSPILELGCGDFSTPVLASICSGHGRPFRIISSDPTWAARYDYLTARGVTIDLIDHANWPETPLPHGVGMALVDNEQRVRDRLRLVARLADCAKVVLLHDVNVVLRRRHLWKPIVDQYRHCHIFRRRVPYTAVLSNHVDPTPWFSHEQSTGEGSIRSVDKSSLSTAFESGWRSGGSETACGKGSTIESTETLRREWPSIVEQFRIRSANDAGCGDLNWQRLIDVSSLDYRGYDVVRWPTWARQDCVQLDCEVADFTQGPLRPCDLTLCRDAMIHLPNDMVLASIANFRSSSTYLLATSFDNVSNEDRIQRPGGFSRLDLTAAPFSLGEPILRIDEPFPNKYLGLWRLRGDEG